MGKFIKLICGFLEKSSVVFIMAKGNERNLESGIDRADLDVELDKRISDRLAWIGSDVRIYENNGVVYVDTDDQCHAVTLKRKYDNEIRESLEACGFEGKIKYPYKGMIKGKQMSLMDVGARSEPKGSAYGGSGGPSLHSSKNETGFEKFTRVTLAYSYPMLNMHFMPHGGLESALHAIKKIGSGEAQGGRPYLFFGECSAGKTEMFSRGINLLNAKQLSVAYVDLNKLAAEMYMNFEHNRKNPGNKIGVEPGYIATACDADVLFIDELKGLRDSNKVNRIGTQRVIRGLLDHFHGDGKPVVASFTGNVREYLEMVGDLKSGKKDTRKKNANKDLGSRLENFTRVEVKSLLDSDRLDFTRKYLVKTGIVGEENLEDAALAVYNSLPVGASVRSIIGAAETVNHDVESRDGFFDDESIGGLLGGTGQRSMFGDFAFPDQLLDKVSKFTGVSIEDITSKDRGAKIVAARDLAAWALVNEMGQTRANAGRLLKRNHSTVTSAVRKIKRVFSQEGKLSDKEAHLRNLVSEWAER